MQIETLIPDIYSLIQSKGGWNAVSFETIADHVGHSVQKTQTEGRLRLSGLGRRCECALWHSIHHPERAEPLPPFASFKYVYGHIIEALVIQLAKASGHDVTGEQDEIILDGVTGHRDCVIDGAVVDVKSTSSIGFKKFRDRTLAQDDSFGYLDQLDAYVVGSALADDPLVRDRSYGYILAVDKQLGHMCLYKHKVRHESIRSRIQHYKEVVSRPQPPACNCGTVADGKSGNIRLDTRASYSPFKLCCFPQLRSFKYSDGVRHLCKVVREPEVPEIKHLTTTLH